MGAGVAGLKRRLGMRRLAVVICAVSVAAGLSASSASAVIVHLSNGQTKSYQPLRGKAAALDALFSNLDYNGGPVMPSNTNYTLYWRPAGAAAYPSDYQPGVNRYLTDLGHDSGLHTNVDSTSTQYNDTRGDSAKYKSSFAGALVDTDPYPKSGCAGATVCLTDAQIQAEISKYLTAHGLPRDRVHQYFLLTPPGVESCFDASGTQGCSAGSSVNPKFCAFHSASFDPAGEFIYSNDPYVSGNFGCDDGNHPNGTTSDGALQGGLSHEHNESITDPEPNNAWTDIGGIGGENGDKCGQVFGTPLGNAPNGATYNQLINGHQYWYQTEWSNQGNTCLQRLTPSLQPVATFTSSPSGGLSMSFSAAGSTTGTSVNYNWQFNDGPGLSVPDETTAPSDSHLFPGPGLYTVALTVFKGDGTSIGTSRKIRVSDEAPSGAFSVLDSAPSPGKPVAFSGAASHDADGSITAYDWNFGDGSAAGTGASPSHTYAAAGTYQVTMTATDSSAQTTTLSHSVIVDEAPTAAFTSSPLPAQAVKFNGASSSDPDGSITSYDWNFGDGTAHGTGVSPSHTYATPGAKTVTLTVTDSTGHHVAVTHQLTVADENPTAAFSYSALPGHVAKFNGTTSKDPDGSITSYDWNFGDGTAHGTGVSPSHTYATPGTKSVTLTVTDSTGHIGSMTQNVVIT